MNDTLPRRPQAAPVVMPTRPELGTLSVLLEGHGRKNGQWAFAVVAAVLFHLAAFLFVVLPAKAVVLIPVDVTPFKPYRPDNPPVREPKVQPEPVARLEKPESIKVPVPNLPEPPEVIREPSPEPASVEVAYDPEPWVPVLPDPPIPAPTETVDIQALGMTAPQVVFRAQPDYPPAAVKVRLQGAVILNLLIDTEGLVEEVEVVHGKPMGLTEAAIRAAEQWRFVPMKLGDRPVKVRYQLTVHFNLR